MSSLDSPALDDPPPRHTSPDQFRISSPTDDDYPEEEEDEDDDTQSISLSTPPQSPHRPARFARPPSDILLPSAEPPDEEDGLAYVQESGAPWTRRSETRQSLTSATSESRLVDSPVSTRAPVDGAAALGPAFELKEEEGETESVAPLKTPLSSRILRFPSSAASPVATMPVPRPRPASLPLTYVRGELILGIVVIDFNHLVGPKVEFAVPPAITSDEQLCGLLPFLALPDGAHMNSEDYSYFHIPTSYPGLSTTQTVFGISCNRQIQASQLINKSADVTRSTVQKAVVVLASKPIFGPIRDKLGVVTKAYFNQLDFGETEILIDFFTTLEQSLTGQLTESALYMGTSLRELVHKFRHKTLTLLKMLLLQKKIMFFGQPVETLCTYQYSLVSLIPGLLDQLQDCAAPGLDGRENDFERPSELRTSERGSLLRYLGLPLNVFGKDAFFQPYLPLQEVDMLKSSASYLCGTTNNIVTQQRDARPDLLINIESNTFEFCDARTERSVALTGADRKWMDEIVRSVEGTWSEKDPGRPVGMQFLGSDDYVRAKFEDYICSALAGIKYADFLAKGVKGDVLISGGGGHHPPNVLSSFGEAFVHAFRGTRAGVLWDRTTDPVLFDICEPRHPCEAPPSIASDIGVRLAEGLSELNIEERIAPAREALSSAFASGMKGLESVQARFRQQTTEDSGSALSPIAQQQSGGTRPTGLRQLSLVGSAAAGGVEAAGRGVGAVVGGWGTWVAGRLGGSQPGTPGTPAAAAEEKEKAPGSGLRTFGLVGGTPGGGGEKERKSGGSGWSWVSGGKAASEGGSGSGGSEESPRSVGTP